MKKSFILALLIVSGFAGSFGYGQEFDSVHTVNFFQGLNFPYHKEYDHIEILADYKFHNQELNCFGGFEVSKRQMNVAFEACYMPEILKLNFAGVSLAAGYNQILHYGWHYSVCHEFDFLPGLSLLFDTNLNWIIQLKVSYLLKLSTIFALNNEVPCIADNDIAFYFLVQRTYKRARLKFGMSSYSNFDFPKFISPFWFVDYEYKFTEKISGELVVNARYIDMFTLSSYLENVEVHLGVGIRL